MKPETERLLQQCRAALLQFDNAQLDALFTSWFERAVGDEAVEELLDDLCLLLHYGIRVSHSKQVYATYTAWWEVEGMLDGDGEFVCSDSTALQQYLINMPIKDFSLIAKLAHFLCQVDALAENQPAPPVGQVWLLALATWLRNGAPEPFHIQIWQADLHASSPAIPPEQLSRKQRRAQQQRLANTLLEQAWQLGYLLLGPDVGKQIQALVQNRCKNNCCPYISVQPMGSQFAHILIELSPVRRAFEKKGKLFSGAPDLTFLPDDTLWEPLMEFSRYYSDIMEEPFTLSRRGDVFELKQVLQDDVPEAVRDFMTLWPTILAQYEAQLETSRAAYLVRQRELEEARKPAWMKAIARLKNTLDPDTGSLELPDVVDLPEEWWTLLSKEQLGAFLTFLKLPASSREIKANLVQHLQPRLEADRRALALFFEIFAFELAVPPWELEKLLACTTPERKRWTEEEKLPVLGHGSFRKAGRDHAYPLYDRRIILALTSEQIETWRDEHRAVVRERRRASAQAAAASRKAKREQAQVEQPIPESAQ